jgi:hypothetical protein
MKPFDLVPRGVLMATIVGAFVAGFAVETAHAQSAPGMCSHMATGLPVFHSRIENYAALHRRLAGFTPPMETRPDVQSLRINRKALGLALRSARIDAKIGDIFGGPVEETFRCLIATAERKSEGWLSGLSEEFVFPLGIGPFVNETYPPVLLGEVPYVLQLLLPPIPEEVEYVVMDNNLVLWDTYAEVVIDVLPNAFGVGFVVDETR